MELLRTVLIAAGATAVTVAYVLLCYMGIGALFNGIQRKSGLQFVPSIGWQLIVWWKESRRLARAVRGASSVRDPVYAAALHRRPADTPLRHCRRASVIALHSYMTYSRMCETFATVRLSDGSVYHMIHVANYHMTDGTDRQITLPCVVSCGLLPVAGCTIDPRRLPEQA